MGVSIVEPGNKLVEGELNDCGSDLLQLFLKVLVLKLSSSILEQIKVILHTILPE